MSLLAYTTVELRDFLTSGDARVFLREWMAQHGRQMSDTLIPKDKADLSKAMNDYLIKKAQQKRKDDLEKFAREWVRERGYNESDILPEKQMRELADAMEQFYKGKS